MATPDFSEMHRADGRGRPALAFAVEDFGSFPWTLRAWRAERNTR